MPRKKAIEEVVEEPVAVEPQVSEKEELLALYEGLKKYGINRIGQLEEKLANS